MVEAASVRASRGYRSAAVSTRLAVACGALCLLLVPAMLISLSMGPVTIPPDHLLGILLKPLGLRVTRIARGLPTGGDLEYADQVTLAKALEGRREMG